VVLKLLAFDARLAGVPPALLEALWEAIDRLAAVRPLPSELPVNGHQSLRQAQIPPSRSGSGPG
jgi:hypothetical protein